MGKLVNKLFSLLKMYFAEAVIESYMKHFSISMSGYNTHCIFDIVTNIYFIVYTILLFESRIMHVCLQIEDLSVTHSCRLRPPLVSISVSVWRLEVVISLSTSISCEVARPSTPENIHFGLCTNQIMQNEIGFLVRMVQPIWNHKWHTL